MGRGAEPRPGQVDQPVEVAVPEAACRLVGIAAAEGADPGSDGAVGTASWGRRSGPRVSSFLLDDADSRTRIRQFFEFSTGVAGGPRLRIHRQSGQGPGPELPRTATLRATTEKTTTARLAAAAPILAPRMAALAGTPGGIGVLGDSYSDEYRFYPPDRSTARNWVEILASTRGLDFGPYADESRGEPRNQGYAFNWARSDATTDDLIRTGQHTGLAAQVARGEVGIVVLFIGGNDFINAMKGPDPSGGGSDAAPGPGQPPAGRPDHPRRQPAGQARPRHAPGHPTCRNSPGRSRGPPAVRRGRCLHRGDPQVQRSDPVSRRERSGALVDLDLATRAANLMSTEYTLVDGRKLDRMHPGNTLDRFFLADVRHPGTLGQGLMARMFIETVNAKFAAGIAPSTRRRSSRWPVRSRPHGSGRRPREPGRPRLSARGAAAGWNEPRKNGMSHR